MLAGSVQLNEQRVTRMGMIKPQLYVGQIIPLRRSPTRVQTPNSKGFEKIQLNYF